MNVLKRSFGIGWPQPSRHHGTGVNRAEEAGARSLFGKLCPEPNG